MSLSVGIVGFPNAGKSTLFNALTGKSVAVSPHIFTTIDPNRGIVGVDEPYLPDLQKIYECAKIVPADVTFVDVAGLIKGAHKGEGLGNQFLGNIRNTDAICLVLRSFEGADVPLAAGKLDPVDEMKVLETELILADLEVVEKAYEKRARSVKLGEKKFKEEADALVRVKEKMEAGAWARDAELTEREIEVLKSFALITMKDIFVVANVSESDLPGDTYHFKEGLESYAASRGAAVIPICAKLEMELSELPPEEAKVFAEDMGLSSTGLDRVVGMAYRALDLITFYTGNEKEVRAWSLKRGSSAIEAAGKIHSDMAAGFIRAEVIPAVDLIMIGSYSKARDQGALQVVGRDYVVKDGDVVLIRFSK